MVFISYSSRDYDLACTIRKFLSENRIHCWMAPESIPAGGDYSRAIPGAIEKCDVFLLILSENSQQSKWVPKELDLAITYDKTVIPFHVDQSEIAKPFHFRLVDVQIVDASANLNRGLKKLYTQIMSDSILPDADTVSTGLPDYYTYYEMLQVSSAREIDIEGLRSQSDVTRSLSIPIGINEDNEIVKLDIHHRGDGPNGLIIGPKGSGKSEFLITLFLSLGLHFTTEDVSLHMIDLKGGGIVKELSGLPHLGACLTDDSEEARHAFYSRMEEEIRKRSALLEAHSVSNIYQYLKKRKNNPEIPPMPHIVIAFDEIAELKRNYPDLANALREWGSGMNATLLGTHLVYATAKYGGVIDDSIHYLVNYRICSNMYKSEFDTGDDPEIQSRCPGRLYFHSPYQEKIQLIQLAYSEADVHAGSTTDQRSKTYRWFFGNQRQRTAIIQHINRTSLD